MSEYELADHTASLMSNFLSAMTIYFSIITAYVVAAFSAGNRLTRLQLVIVNATFTIAAGIMGLLSCLLFNRFHERASIVVSEYAQDKTPLVDFGVPLAILVLIMYVGCLVFMWSVRRKLESSD